MTTIATTPAANVATPVVVPSVHRRALITWLAVYPTITIALALLGPEMGSLPVFVRTLILTAIVVPVSAYLLIPLLMKANHHLTLRWNR
ncbi:hypothetical protein [Nocardia sp. CDC160]|uniref:hypothetical protein n=1 Tax=Nocardia sp. CDC160 TaxID=3112166 RepID=UPI002DB5ACED|nr:hypothetical protein [Nocardia sp. CDC160]MEC3920056.1 hypothetical protein [Nocardia sp. CDC160]